MKDDIPGAISMARREVVALFGATPSAFFLFLTNVSSDRIGNPPQLGSILSGLTSHNSHGKYQLRTLASDWLDALCSDFSCLSP